MTDDVDRLLRPTLIRPVAEDRYEITLEDALGEQTVVTLTVQWEPKLGSWTGRDFDPPLLVPGDVRFDTRRLVKLASAMHESIHHQFSSPGEERSPTG